MRFRHRLPGDERMNHVDMWGRVFKAEGRMCKGPEADGLVWLASRSNRGRRRSKQAGSSGGVV